MPDVPYQSFPPEAFWRTGVAEADISAFEGMYAPKVRLRADTRIMTAGSCFAQHISRALKAQGMALVETEKVEGPLSAAMLSRFGYGQYSARYGNIYTVRQLRQLMEEARDRFEPNQIYWRRDDRVFDALRPGVEPNGWQSIRHAKIARAQHISCVQHALDETDVLVFTLGLTEAWEHIQSGTVFPTAPGVIAGEFRPRMHRFRNFNYDEVIADFLATRALLHETRPKMRFILTVSPVPLTATASGNHVLVATQRSKAVLRAAAGYLAETCDDVDYFPSYEMVMHPQAGPSAFEDNLRNPRSEIVARVIAAFLRAHDLEPTEDAPLSEFIDDDEVACEESLLEAFAT